MPLEVSCPSCQGHFRIPDSAAGKKIRCPKCKGAIDVPSAAGPVEAPAAKPQLKSQPKPERWFLKTEEGDEFGPAPRGELEQWKAEGRITAECQLLLEGSDQWQWASDVFADLAEEEPPATKVSKSQLPQPADEGPPSSRSRLVAGLLGIFLGPLGIHRFYLGYWVIGLLMLLTAGGCGIWSLVDAILVFVGRVNDADGRRLSP